MREIKPAVRREQSRNLGKLTLVDVFMVAIAQVADRFTFAQLLHRSFQLAHARFEIGCHGSSSNSYFFNARGLLVLSTILCSPTKPTQPLISSRAAFLFPTLRSTTPP